MASTPTKVPGLPRIPPNADPEIKAYLEALGEALEIRLGRRGDERDRAITLRELIESGLALKLKSKPFDPNRDVARDSLGISPINGPIVTVPPPPSNLVASGAFKNVILTWTDPNFLYGNHAYAEIFRQDAQAADPDAIAKSQTLGSAGNLNFNGILGTENADNGTIQNSTITFDVPTKVTITSLGSDESGRNFTVTGTNASGSSVNSGAVAGPTASATKEFSSTSGDGLFKTVTEIACSNNIVGNVSAGCAESADAIGSATAVGQSGAMTVTDSSVQAGRAYFYWARFVSTSGIAGPFNKTAGTIASTVRIQETDISEDAVTTPKLKAGSITADGAQLATASVVTANIANLAVTNAQMANATIISSKIANAAITNALIGTAAVSTLSIDNNQVTVPELIEYSNAAISATTSEQGVFTSAVIAPTGLTSSLRGSVLITCFGYHSAMQAADRDSGVTLKLSIQIDAGSGFPGTWSEVMTQISGAEADGGSTFMSLPFSMSHLAQNVYRLYVKLTATPLRIQASESGALGSCTITNPKILLMTAKR